jgi:hypothetical protein
MVPRVYLAEKQFVGNNGAIFLYVKRPQKRTP